jgi:kynurenine formamidase
MVSQSRRSFFKSLVAQLLAPGWLAAIMSARHQNPAQGPAGAIRTDADIEALIPRITNWGRWGKGDQIGTLNYIQPSHRTRAVRLVKAGQLVSLAREVSLTRTPGVQEGRHEVRRADLSSRDVVGMIPHGFALSHLDALCHAFASADQMYNGFATSLIAADGARALGIENMGGGICSRGVLLDIGHDRPLEPGTAITVRDLETTERRCQVRVGEGDVLFVRTGAGMRNTRDRRAGLHPECLPWLHERRVAVLGGDGDSDAHPLEGFERYASALHSVGIPYLGLPLLDNLDLDPLGRACTSHRRWEFLTVVAPWRLTGGTASVINPMALL